MKIAFYTPQLTFRGSCVALYDYAKYNEDLLGNSSLIITPKSCSSHSSDNNACAFRWILNRFPIHFFTTHTKLEEYLLENHYDLVYVIKHGQMDDIIFNKIPFVVHCVFDMNSPHGSVYAAVSKSLADKFGLDLYVPHMVSMDSHCLLPSLRRSLNIPDDAVVFGRYGGMDTFNIPWAIQVITKIVSENDNVYFLFMNTPRWMYHPQVIHIPAIANQEFKKRFIISCDAMIVPESLGHTFGLSIAEFQVFNRPIICFDDGRLWNRAHVDVLGTDGIYFSNAESLYKILTTFIPFQSRNTYSDYTPKRVMTKFSEVFLTP